MMVALDEGPGPPIRYQYAELGKLFSVVSLLVRCCDVSVRMRSSAAVSAVDLNSVILQLFSLDTLSIYLFVRHLFIRLEQFYMSQVGYVLSHREPNLKRTRSVRVNQSWRFSLW